MTLYASLAEVKSELKASSTVDDAKVIENIRQASARIDALLFQRRPMFAPWIESRELLVDGANVNSWLNTIKFDAHLLAASGVTRGTSSLVIGTDVELWPVLQSPASMLRLKSRYSSWYSDCDNCDGTPLMVTIAGTWGFNRDYANAWLTVDALAAAITTTTATTFTVADVDGADGYGRTPRISAGNLLRIDSEFMEVVSTNTSTNVITVKRGVNGSTAATHIIASNVEVWQVEEIVKRAVIRQAAFMYARRGAYESSNITDVGVVNFPSDLLGEVRGMVQAYAYE